MTNQLEQLYQQVILDHARSAHGRGLAVLDEDPRSAHAESHQVNPTCGDEVTLRVTVSRSDTGGGDVVEQVRWDGQGCSISQASLSVLTDLVTGRSADEAEQLGETFRALMASQGKGLDESLEDELGDATAFTGVSQFPARIKCALMSWMAWKDATVQSAPVEEQT